MSPGAPVTTPHAAVVRRRAFGTEAVLAVSEPGALVEAEHTMVARLDAIDRACSRFRADAEIASLVASPGTWVAIGSTLFDALEAGCWAACHSAGAVDFTVARALEHLGYDRDFAEVAADGPPVRPLGRAPGWQSLELDAERRRARLAPGVGIDLGCSAKAWAADVVAAGVAELGTGVLVSIGGDVSTAGEAPGPGWPVGVAADSGAAATEVEQVVELCFGGLATSSTRLRSWRRGVERFHHIVDPATGSSVAPVWQTVTVAAASCLEANTFSTAAMVWGEGAPQRLAAMGLPARLVGGDGTVLATPAWPAPRALT